MDIFDKIGDKISQTAQVVKISGLIADEEKRINANFLEIGKICFERISENPDAEPEEFAAQINQINDAKAKIADYSEQIKKLKGYIKCEHCGTEIPPDDIFCSGCGSKLEKVNIPSGAGSPCSNCGANNPAGMAFCTKCGAKIADENDGLICKGCGASLSPDLAFCTNCGQKKE